MSSKFVIDTFTLKTLLTDLTYLSTKSFPWINCLLVKKWSTTRLEILCHPYSFYEKALFKM